MKKLLFLLSLFISATLGAQNVHNTIQDTSMTGPYPLGVNANLKTSANYFNKGAAFNNFSFAYGTSITFGQFAISYYTTLQTELGNTTYANYAVASTALRTACRAVATNQGTKLQGASIGDPAFNNSRWGFATGGLDTTHLFQLIKAGSRWLTAAQFTDTLQFYRIAAGTVNPNVTTSQSALTALVLDTLRDLGSRSLFFGTNSWWKQSITANETYTNTLVKGKNLIIGVWADSIGGSRIQYAVDGITIGTYDPNKISGPYVDFDAPTGFHRLGIQNDVIVINGLKDTLHTVVLTFLDGGKFGGVDFIGNMREPQIAAFAPIYVMDVQHMNATGYAVTGGSAVVQDSASNSRWQDQLNTFPNYVGAAAIIRVNVNISAGGHYDPNDPTQINSDGIHPLGPGYRNMVIDIINAINPKSKPDNNNVAALTAGQILYPNSSGALASSSNFYTDGSSVSIGTSTISDKLAIVGTVSGGVLARAQNNSNAGFSGFQAVNDGLQSIGLRLRGSAIGAYGSFINNSGGLYSNSTGGMVFMQDNGNPITFCNGTGAPALARLIIDVNGMITPGATATYDLGTSSLAWRSVLATGANSHGHVNVSGTGTYSALGTDYTIEFTGTTATLAYPTVNLVNGRQLNIVNYGSGSLTIPSTKSGNAATITTLTTNQRAIVEYDLANTTWIIVSLN